MIRIVSFNSYGDLTVLIKDTKYRYYYVNPGTKKKLETYIRHKNWKSSFALLNGIVDYENIG